MQEAENTDAIIGDIKKGIKGMAASYRYVATMEIDVIQTFNKANALLTATQQTTAGFADTVNAEIATHQKAMAALEHTLKLEPNAIEKRKKEISIAGLKSRINSVRWRKTLWNKLS